MLCNESNEYKYVEMYHDTGDEHPHSIYITNSINKCKQNLKKVLANY